MFCWSFSLKKIHFHLLCRSWWSVVAKTACTRLKNTYHICAVDSNNLKKKDFVFRYKESIHFRCFNKWRVNFLTLIYLLNECKLIYKRKTLEVKNRFQFDSKKWVHGELILIFFFVFVHQKHQKKREKILSDKSEKIN